MTGRAQTVAGRCPSSRTRSAVWPGGYGARGRVGLILPADNAVIEPELAELPLDGVSFHVARIPTTNRDEMPERGIEASRIFVEMDCRAIVYACAETSFLGGIDANSVIIERIKEATGVPAITATWVMVEGLRALGVKKIGLVTPYVASRGQVMEEFLQRSGIEVIASTHRDFHEAVDDPREWLETNAQPPETSHSMVRGLGAVQADGYLISATNFATLRGLGALEESMGRPVVSTNQAIVWWASRTLGAPLNLSGYGRLLDSP
jgi:maleate isomerase